MKVGFEISDGSRTSILFEYVTPLVVFYREEISHSKMLILDVKTNHKCNENSDAIYLILISNFRGY